MRRTLLIQVTLVLTALVIGLTLLPVLARRHEIIIPPDIQLVSALFVFLSLFLGSAVDRYYKYWWWDMVRYFGEHSAPRLAIEASNLNRADWQPSR